MKVCVMGLGRIGLPIALVAAKKGHYVVGVDPNQQLVTTLRTKHCPFYEPGVDGLLQSVNERFTPTTELKAAVEGSDIVLVCVGTRKYADKKPDLTIIVRLVEQLAKLDLRDKLIVFKTTFPVGTTKQLVSKLEQLTGLECEESFYAAFCPERIVEGRAVEEAENITKIIGGIGPRSVEKALLFYRTIGGTLVPVDNTNAAEMVKLIDNAYRITRFAFANEIALMAEGNNLDAYKLIEAANKDYPRNDIPLPSCGVGGYCLTKDPWYLEECFNQVARRRGFDSLWLYARKVNDHMVAVTADKVEVVLRQSKLELAKSNILVCGITYKANIDDVRDSHGVLLAEEFQRRGAAVGVWDPQVNNPQLPFKMYSSAAEGFEGRDIAVFTVKHKEFEALSHDMRDMISLMRTRLIFDGANVFAESKPAGFTLLRTGVSSPLQADQEHAAG